MGTIGWAIRPRVTSPLSISRQSNVNCRRWMSKPPTIAIGTSSSSGSTSCRTAVCCDGCRGGPPAAPHAIFDGVGALCLVAGSRWGRVVLHRRWWAVRRRVQRVRARSQLVVSTPTAVRIRCWSGSRRVVTSMVCPPAVRVTSRMRCSSRSARAQDDVLIGQVGVVHVGVGEGPFDERFEDGGVDAGGDVATDGRSVQCGVPRGIRTANPGRFR